MVWYHFMLSLAGCRLPAETLTAKFGINLDTVKNTTDRGKA